MRSLTAVGYSTCSRPGWLLWWVPSLSFQCQPGSCPTQGCSGFITPRDCHCSPTYLRPGSLGHTSSWLRPHPILPLSSANLSDSYFTNRQDRYVFLQDCAEIADFFTELVDAVGDVSLQLQGDDTVDVVDGMVHPYKGRAACSIC